MHENFYNVIQYFYAHVSDTILFRVRWAFARRVAIWVGMEHMKSSPPTRWNKLSFAIMNTHVVETKIWVISMNLSDFWHFAKDVVQEKSTNLSDFWHFAKGVVHEKSTNLSDFWHFAKEVVQETSMKDEILNYFCCKKYAVEKSNLYYEYWRCTGYESTFKGSVLWCFQNQCDEVHGATN